MNPHFFTAPFDCLLCVRFRTLRQSDIRLGSDLSDLILAAAGHGYDERQRHFGFQQAQNEFIGGILPAFFLASDFAPLFAEFHSSAVYAYTQVAHGYSALSVKEI